jgi:chemotaxis protein histidine kinase CheA/DNA-binding response OmpR family regulator
VAQTTGVIPRLQARPPVPKAKMFDQTMRVPIKQLDNLSNLIGELVVKRNTLEDDQERLRQSLDNLLNQVQSLGEMGARMHDLYERTLLEGALLASRNPNRTIAGGKTTEMSSASPADLSGGDGSYTLNGELDALEMDRFTGFHLLSQEMIELIVRIRESTSDIQFLVDDTDQVTRTLRQATTQLQEGMTKSRMVSFAQTADRLPRAIREVSIRLNKQAKLYVEGKDVLIDKMILEQLYNPMTHLVNNAIAHGIETPEERVKNGKPAEGRVTVRAFIQGNQTVITVSDDGAGINPERVKFKAIEKGLITQAQARALSKQEVYDFLFHPGFSTKDKADDFAGRGVGLDVVYTNLSEIRGTVSIDSAIGKGTTFTIRLPLTLSICKALCCVSERSRIAFPIDGVEDTKDYLPSDVHSNEEGRKCVYWREMELPIYPLSELLNYNRQFSRRPSYTNKLSDDTVAIVILRSAGNLLALQVDRVLGEQEIVIKQIEGPIPKPAGIAGATVLGDGSVMPIGDVLELIEIAQGRMRTDSSASLWKKTYVPIHTDETVRTEPTVLIVDDSITVRQLLSLSFGKAGYRVEQARDGQEALEKLQSGLPCDIVFCDIEMPRMNGLELLSHLQQDAGLSTIPIALLTSRGAQRHRTVAAKLGASGYFTKPYTERDLLDAATRMLKGEVLLPGSTKAPRVAKPEVESFSEVEEAPLAPTNAAPRPAKSENLVLIVDDSVMVREMLSMTFSKAGYRVEQARDGQEAWEKIRTGLPCDLILCDIEMPRMNGLELLSRLQEDEQLSAIPMAMITSRGAQKMQNFAAEKGAKGYFVKPYIEEVLLDAAKRLIAGEVLLKKSSGDE